MIGTVGAPLHLEHKEKLNRCLPGRFYELYGLTEGFMTVLDKNHYASKPTSVGPPQPFFEMRIMNEQGQDAAPREIGEIVGRGPALMPGYYKRPDLTAQAIVDGWLHTGDLGYVDEDGFLYLVDRKKDMIISGGTNVFPKDIEEIIVQHPAVREVAVFGIPSEKWGETPLAAVILNHPGAVTPEALCDWINERVDAKNQRVQRGGSRWRIFRAVLPEKRSSESSVNLTGPDGMRKSRGFPGHNRTPGPPLRPATRDTSTESIFMSMSYAGHGQSVN